MALRGVLEAETSHFGVEQFVRMDMNLSRPGPAGDYLLAMKHHLGVTSLCWIDCCHNKLTRWSC